MKFSTALLILALSAAPLFVQGTNHDHDDEEERRTLRDAQFDTATTAGTNGYGAKRPTRKLSKNSPPLPPRPVFCDDFTMYWNTTAYYESILIIPSLPPQWGTKTCRYKETNTSCRGDNAQAYFNLYTDPALTKYGGRYADNQLIVQADPNSVITLVTGSIEVETPDFGGELIISNLFGESNFLGTRLQITAGSKNYLGATGTVQTNTDDDEVVGEFIVRCELTNPSNP